MAELVEFFSWDGAVGCTFPAVVRKGVVLSAANVDADWVGVHGGEIFTESIGRPVVLLNDADAAGIAEFRFGVARRDGVVFVLTFGTGIGSAVFVEGHLMPNTEFGRIEFKGMHAEHYSAARVREAEGLTMKRWARRVDRYLTYLNELPADNQGASTPRPMTHDLLSDIIGKLDAEVVAVTVTELRDNTFYASITVQMNGSEIEVDSRPSDAIALAVRSDAPIFAADEVIEESAIEFEGDDGPPENVAAMSDEQRAQVEEQFKEFLENVTPDQFAAAEPEDD